MKRLLIVVFALSLAAHAQNCIGAGNLHMIEPASTVYCVENGRIVWAVTYSFSERLIIVQDSRKTRFWSFPLSQDSVTHGRQEFTKENKTKVLEFSAAFGTITEDHWLPVALTGNP